jgi:hypothetical protein
VLLARNLWPWEANFVARELRAALDDGAAGVGELWLGSQENTLLSSRIISRGCQGTFSPGRHTSRNLLETAEGFDADSGCGRGRTEQGHLQKSLKRLGAISVYLTVC